MTAAPEAMVMLTLRWNGREATIGQRIVAPFSDDDVERLARGDLLRRFLRLCREEGVPSE